jgi:hypothetical protein
MATLIRDAQPPTRRYRGSVLTFIPLGAVVWLRLCYAAFEFLTKALARPQITLQLRRQREPLMNRNDTYVKWHAFKRNVALALALLLLCAAACERSPTVHLEDGNPPRFGYTGSGYLEFFVVEEVAPENQNVPDVEQDTDKNRKLWWIFPKDSSAGKIRNLSQITYGIVPSDFVQKVPSEGAPPPLVEGKIYEAGGPAISMSKGYLRFTIRNGKPVQLPIPRRP